MAILSDIPRRQVPLFWLEADPVQKVAMVVGAVLVLLALLTPLIAPVDPNAQSLIARLRPPSGWSGDNRAICWAPTNWAVMF
ncbi:hypothetical protein ABWH93_01790 [Seohaeicola saemankumensis]|uniref:hypothetical protein n=1 Tax=Seohaeicola saemankumensis TaxID=481181 RepID=UPI0035CF995C